MSDVKNTTHDAASEKTIQIEVLRYRPDVDPVPWTQVFDVPWKNETSILEALQYIKDHLDSSLTFRWSCRMAVCGSCGVVVNGEPKLACSTFIRDYPEGTKKLRVDPLDNFDVEKDLVVNIDPFLQKLESIKPYIIRKTGAEVVVGEDGKPQEYMQMPAQLAKFKELTMCINCMLCYSACPQVAMNVEFLGPATIALATRYNYDSRDEGEAERKPVLYQENGVWPCTFVGYCSEVCPKHVDPGGSIQQNKSRGLMYWAGNLLSGGSKAAEKKEG
jgi:fumarate reductase iron-sulfur subunit